MVSGHDLDTQELMQCVIIILYHAEPDGPPQNIQITLVAGVPNQVMFNLNPPRVDLQNGFITEYRISCVDNGRTRQPVINDYPESVPRRYAVSNIIPATLFESSVSAST